ncbi:MAG: 6,7-dimethyl-8-ribityllumazine synthase [Candidatus Nanopelagicaceae bacterium]|nr:6,7-dimethyl-8-ribityllumazine synthase [Candidatus Nanopelagicaceae bacterium]
MAGVAPAIKLDDMSGFRVAVISASWHKEICEALVAGAHRALESAQVKIEPVNYVPGSFELPLAAQYALDSGFDAAVVLGVVVRGETPHFDYVCQGVTDGVMKVSLDRNKPIGFGVLTVDDIDQAKVRSGVPGSKEDKGFDATVAALELLKLANGFAGNQG